MNRDGQFGAEEPFQRRSVLNGYAWAQEVEWFAVRALAAEARGDIRAARLFASDARLAATRAAREFNSREALCERAPVASDAAFTDRYEQE